MLLPLQDRVTRFPEARILLVEDDPSIVSLLDTILYREGYRHVLTTSTAREAVLAHAADRPDLVLLDWHLPDQDGVGLLQELRAATAEDDYLPVLVLSGDLSPEVREQALSCGGHDFVAKPFDRVEILLRIENLLETRSLHRKVLERNDLLQQTIEERTLAYQIAQVEILERLAQAMEVHDDATGRHTRRVGAFAARIADAMRLPVSEVELIRRAAPLHDIGKIGIPREILLKRGTLTPEEFTVMKTHTVIGAAMLAEGCSPLIRMAEQVARSHHERWDGAGYPDGLREAEIPIAARIVAVADAWDALAHDRPYRKAWPREAIVEEFHRQGGRHFDPRVVEGLFESGIAPYHPN